MHSKELPHFVMMNRNHKNVLGGYSVTIYKLYCLLINLGAGYRVAGREATCHSALLKWYPILSLLVHTYLQPFPDHLKGRIYQTHVVKEIMIPYTCAC